MISSGGVMMKIAFTILLLSLFFVFGCDEDYELPDQGLDTSGTTVNNFEECVAAGNPVMESYPRQCRAEGKTFVEIVLDVSGLTIDDALKIARNSECTEEGDLTDTYFYNENTKTWWIDLDLEKEGCNPACVVSEKTKTAEINWRCTGLIPE